MNKYIAQMLLRRLSKSCFNFVVVVVSPEIIGEIKTDKKKDGKLLSSY